MGVGRKGVRMILANTRVVLPRSRLVLKRASTAAWYSPGAG